MNLLAGASETMSSLRVYRSSRSASMSCIISSIVENLLHPAFVCSVSRKFLTVMVIGSSPPLAYCTIVIVMSSKVVYLHICICIRTSHCLYPCTHRLRAAVAFPWPAAPPPTQFSGRVDLFSPACYRMTSIHVTIAVFKLKARFFDTFKVRRCWIKIDSAVNLGETPSSEFVQCVLWVIRLTKTVESICCAVRHSVTLAAESCLTNDTLTTFSSSSDCYDDWRRP